MRLRRRLLIVGALAVVTAVVLAGVLYALLTFAVLPLRDGVTLGTGGAVTTVVAGNIGPIAIGAYLFEVADGSVGLIDAGLDPDAPGIRTALSRLGKTPADVRAIFLTHGHNDHAIGSRAFPSAAVYAMEPDLGPIERRRQSGGRGPAHAVRDGEVVDVSGTAVEVFGLPGHTPGSAAFLVHGVLFLGDSAAGLRDGTLQPNTMISADGAQTVRSLRALADRLSSRGGSIRHIAFGHQGPATGLEPLLAWAAVGVP